MGFHCFNRHFVIFCLYVHSHLITSAIQGPEAPLKHHTQQAAAMDGKMGGHEPSMAQRPGPRWCHGSFNDVPSGWFTTTGWGVQTISDFHSPYKRDDWLRWLMITGMSFWNFGMSFLTQRKHLKREETTDRWWLMWSLRGPRDALRRLGDGRTTDLAAFCVELPEILKNFHWFNHCLVVWNMNFIFHFIYGMSSFPLTNSYFSEGWLNHQPDQIQ